jgi:hypothetical protein
LASVSRFISGGFDGTNPEFSAAWTGENCKQQANVPIKRVNSFTLASVAASHQDSRISGLSHGHIAAL